MSDSALKGGAVFEGEGQAAIRVGCGVVGGEVGSSAGLAAERLAVTDFLQVVQAAGDALIAVRVEGVRFDEGEMNYFRNSNEKWTTAINGKKKTPATMTAAGA